MTKFSRTPAMIEAAKPQRPIHNNDSPLQVAMVVGWLCLLPKEPSLPAPKTTAQPVAVLTWVCEGGNLTARSPLLSSFFPTLLFFNHRL